MERARRYHSRLTLLDRALSRLRLPVNVIVSAGDDELAEGWADEVEHQQMLDEGIPALPPLRRT